MKMSKYRNGYRWAISMAVFLAACSGISGGPSGGDPEVFPSASDGGGQDLSTGGASRFSFSIGGQSINGGPVTLTPIKDSGAFAGYFRAQSDPATIPNIVVSIHEPSATLSVGNAYPCANSMSSNSSDETSVLYHSLDGKSYYTNVMSPSCMIEISAASQTSVSASVTGSIYDEMAPSQPVTFTASLVARVVDH
jgi:hypothetical protein